MNETTHSTTRRVIDYWRQPEREPASSLGRAGPHLWVMGPASGPRLERDPQLGAAGIRQEIVRSERERGQWLRDRALRSVLSGQDRELTFTVDARGRPRLDGAGKTAPIIDFNVTRAEGAVGVAVVVNGQIGIDLERRRPVAAGRLRRAFSAAEWAAIDAAEDVDTELLQIWARKEALLKAIGIGLRWPLPEVLDGAVARADGTLDVRPVAELDPKRRLWSVYTLDPISGYVGAFAVASATPGLKPPILHIVDPSLAPS